MAERSSGDLSRSFVGGTMQNVEDGLKSRDGRIFLFLAADWENIDIDIKPFIVAKGNSIPVTCVVTDNLLMCSCIIVMQGKQCGPLHLALVAHCREWLWTKTTPQMSKREVEGSGWVDYINIIWCIDADFKLYRNVTSNVGMCNHRAESGGFWDGFWYIYRRGETTPAYSHIGLDTSASLNNQKHVCQAMKDLIEESALLAETAPAGVSRSGTGGFMSKLFSKKK